MITEAESPDVPVDGMPKPIRLISSFGSDKCRDGNMAGVYGEPQNGCLVRIHSRCGYSEIYSARDCDCGWQLRRSRELLSVSGGVLVYLDQEGRGLGLKVKARAYKLAAEEHLDTFEAYEKMQLPADARDYSEAVEILKELGLRSVRLLTNNPKKIDALESSGITVVRVPLRAEPTPATIAYLAAKKRHGHLL